jgi:SAM-dependent methyltransferase
MNRPDSRLPDPTTRFSDRVDDYVRYRPSYPAAVIQTLCEDAGLVSGTPVADVGSGTGIFAALLLEAGAEVHAVEPNRAMREAAECELGSSARFHSVDGSAEATSLPDGSVELVTAAQAFHWFDIERTRAEFARILRRGGQVALVWNSRRDASTPFLAAYDALLRRYGTDYDQVNHRRVDARGLLDFFDGTYEVRSFPYAQELDWPALRGRLRSSSYTPPPGHPDHIPMLDALERIFAEHAESGHVAIEYDTELYLGSVR